MSYQFVKLPPSPPETPSAVDAPTHLSHNAVTADPSTNPLGSEQDGAASAKLPSQTVSAQGNSPSLPASPLSPPPHENYAGGEATLTLSPVPEVFVAGPPEAGKGGEGGIFQVSNADFVAAIFSAVPQGVSAAICSKSGDPNQGVWIATRADQALGNLSAENNNYVNCSSFSPEADGSFKARKDQFFACQVLLLDDLGGKFPLERLGSFKLSSLIETSPGNYQGTIILKEPITSSEEANALHKRLIDADLCDPGAGGAATRWMRLPNGINGKPKYRDESGAPFHCRLVEWRPDHRYTPEEIIAGLALLPKDGPKEANSSAQTDSRTNQGDDVFRPQSAENPVIVALKARGLYKKLLGSGKHDVTCPWVNEHTDKLDTGAVYYEPDTAYPIGGFCCQHSHRDQYHIKALLDFLTVRPAEARHKPVIRVTPGDLDRVLDAAEKVLASSGDLFQAGGLIASISTDPMTGDPSIVPVSASALTRMLASLATWEKYDGRSSGWMRCDPPTRHLGILCEASNHKHLLNLSGVARQPHFRESDGELVTQAGYDKVSQRFGVFDAKQFPLPDPTREAALAAKALLEDLLKEFHFVHTTDKATALSAIFTAVTRPTLPYAPAFHAKAPVFGSGKTYLCELIGVFGGPGRNSKVSYPTTPEEATKVILSLLLTSPAVVEFDDMDTDWIPHGTIKRMLTAEHITDRILGVSKTATVSTRTLFLGSGNNVGPVRDLLRRVATIHVDPRCATPATLNYQGRPVEKVRKDRGRYVAAVLTIILAWRKAGSPRPDVENIVTFDGAWSDYCRYPLIWLGLPDPATSLLAQVKHDPDSDTLKGLMTEWYRSFGSTPTTVRKAVEAALHGHTDLLDAMREFPVEERGEINRSKLGWLLKKNANRIVGGFEFQQAPADGRMGWCVVAVKSTMPPTSPPFAQHPPINANEVVDLSATSEDDDVPAVVF